MSRKNEEVIDQITTDGQFFVNRYSDGSLGVESINGGELRGSSEDWIFCFQVVANLLRNTR